MAWISLAIICLSIWSLSETRKQEAYSHVFFRAQRLQSFLSKFWFVRLLIIIGSGLTAVSCLSNYPIGKLNIGNLVTSLFTSRYGMKHKSIRTVFVTHVRVSSYCLSQPSMAHRLSSPIFPCWFVCRAIA